MRRPTPIFFVAHTQNTGKILRVTMPLRMPSRISSSVSCSVSKNFSMSPSSFSAAASTSVRCISCAFSISSAGISSMVGSPPSGPHVSFFIRITSMRELKSAPVFTGYCTGTTFVP